MKKTDIPGLYKVADGILINKDNEALDLVHEVFPDKQIEPININDIARQGGLMNCITWNIKT